MLDKLTVLFIYISLAAMWNALAGYGGMISAGQQAFFGLGGYLTIRLSEWASNPIWHSSLPHCWQASWRCPSPQLCCGFAPRVRDRDVGDC